MGSSKIADAGPKFQRALMSGNDVDTHRRIFFPSRFVQSDR
ncbi:hypothetical protein GFS60_03423 [Rhodococcus sp. WAY2]|nr:hypothetical protein GFS60_03423 [Rhodococcus sp. WAY2]